MVYQEIFNLPFSREENFLEGVKSMPIERLDLFNTIPFTFTRKDNDKEKGSKGGGEGQDNNGHESSFGWPESHVGDSTPSE